MTTTFILLQQAAAGSGWSSILMIVALFAIFYFFMIRPQQKRQKEMKQFRDNLTAGSDIVTAGGIYGRVKEVEQAYFIVEITKGVNIRIDKGSVYPSAVDANQAQNNGEQK